MKQYTNKFTQQESSMNYLFEAEKRQERKQSKTLRDQRKTKRSQWNTL